MAFLLLHPPLMTPSSLPILQSTVPVTQNISHLNQSVAEGEVHTMNIEFTAIKTTLGPARLDKAVVSSVLIQSSLSGKKKALAIFY